MIKSIAPVWLAFILVINLPALAQQKDEQDQQIAKHFDTILLRLGKVKTSLNKEVQKVAVRSETGPGLAGPKLTALNELAMATGKEIENKKTGYLSNHHSGQQIDKDLLPLLSGIPEPINSLPRAKQEIKQSTDDNIFTRYIERVKNYREGLADRLQSEQAANQKDEGQLKKEAYQNAKNAEDQLSANPVLQEMGGMENLKNMTQEQRAALARQMAEKIKQNPNAFLTPPKTVTPASRDAALANRDKVVTSMEIEKRMTAILEHAKEMAVITGRLEQETNRYFDDLTKKIDTEYGHRIAALPIIEMGEAGRGKDTYPVDMAYQIVLYPVEKQQATSNKESWSKSLEATKVTIAEYNDLLSEFYGKDKIASQLMTEKGLTPLRLSAGLCESLIRLAESAKFQTSQNASRQRTYDEKIFQLYE